MAALYVGFQLPGQPRRGQLLAGCVAMYAGAGALGVVQLFTSFAAAAESGRAAGLSLAATGQYSFVPEYLITLVAPGFSGQPGGPYWGRGGPWEMSLFVGVTGAGRWPRLAGLLPVLAVAEVWGIACHRRATFDLAQTRAPAVERFLAAQPGDDRLFSTKLNLAIAARREDIWGYAPWALRRYVELIAATQGLPPDTPLQDVQFRRMHPLFRLLRCRYAFTSTGMEELGPVLSRLELVANYRVLTNRDEILRTLVSPEFDPRQVVILESEPNPKPAPGPARGRVGARDFTADALTVVADLPAPAILLITDAYSRGWRVRSLPGSSQQHYQLLPADYALRAVPLAGGRHHFRVEYRPLAFRAGAWVSASALVVYSLTLAWWVTRRARPTGPGP